MANEDLEKEINSKIEEARKLGKKVRRPRDWIKLHCDGVLHGSLNARMSPDQFCIFLKMIVMGEKMGPVPGLISDNDFRPLPYSYLAHLACCEQELFESTLSIAKTEHSVFENSHGIYIINFDKYQFTEYDRQLPYRKAKAEKEKDYKGQKYGHMVASKKGDVERIKG